MAYFLTEKQRIEILMMIGYGENMRTQQQVVQLFIQKYPLRPIAQSAVSRIESKFRIHGHVRDLPRSGGMAIAEDVKLDVLVGIEEDPHKNSRQIAALGPSLLPPLMLMARP